MRHQSAAVAGEWIDNDSRLHSGLPACSDSYTSTHYRVSSSPARDQGPLEETDSFSELDQAVDVILCRARYDRTEANAAKKLM